MSVLGSDLSLSGDHTVLLEYHFVLICRKASGEKARSVQMSIQQSMSCFVYVYMCHFCSVKNLLYHRIGRPLCSYFKLLFSSQHCNFYRTWKKLKGRKTHCLVSFTYFLLSQLKPTSNPNPYGKTTSALCFELWLTKWAASKTLIQNGHIQSRWHLEHLLKQKAVPWTLWHTDTVTYLKTWC